MLFHMFISVLFNIIYTYCKNSSLLFMLFGLQLTAARCPIGSGTRDLSILFCCSLIGSSICSHRWINQGDYPDDVSLWFTAGSYPLGNTQLNQHAFFATFIYQLPPSIGLILAHISLEFVDPCIYVLPIFWTSTRWLSWIAGKARVSL